MFIEYHEERLPLGIFVRHEIVIAFIFYFLHKHTNTHTLTQAHAIHDERKKK